MTNKPAPVMLGLPHDEWREGQYETIQWGRNTKGTLIIQAPTGSGKTGVAAALSAYGNVRALTHTINLQEQYAEQYDFDPLFGMNNYPCAFAGGMDTAAYCGFADAMYHCPTAKMCEYLIQRELVRASNKQSLSYAYFLNAVWTKTDETDFLYCDEAHLLPQITKDYCTAEYTPQQLHQMDVPLYPQVRMRSYKARTKLAVNWLHKIRVRMQDDHRSLSKTNPRYRSTKVKIKLKILTEQIYRLGRTLDYADSHPGEFYTSWDSERFKMMPLSARLYFKDIFISKWNHRAILTSATIGNPKTFGRELGLNHYSFRDVPSQFPPESMPVFTFDDAPKLSYKSQPSAWRKWAEVISRAVNRCDPAWSGIIHVSSRVQAKSLANTLSRSQHGLQDRVVIPEGKGTRAKIKHWQDHKKKVPNTIAIAYSFHMGLDGYDDEINIVAKIPFATLDEFGMAELKYDPGIYKHKAALLTEQACGRIRRGERHHYEESGEPMRKFVAVADNNYIGIQDEFSKHFQSCLTPI